MKMSKIKYCYVPGCKNTSDSAPNKLFFSSPMKDPERQNWIIACRGDEAFHKVSPSYVFLVCEDHFDEENDVENFIRYKWYKENGYKSHVKLKPGIIPHKFVCQPTRLVTRNLSRPSALERKALLQEALQESTTSAGSSNLTLSEPEKLPYLQPIKFEPIIKSEFEEECTAVEEDCILEGYQLIKLEDNIKAEEEEYSPAEDKVTFHFDKDCFKNYQHIKLEDYMEAEEEEYSPAEDKVTFNFDEEEVAYYPYDELLKKYVDPLENSSESGFCTTSTHSLQNCTTIVLSMNEKQVKKKEIESMSGPLSYFCYHCPYKAPLKGTLKCHIKRDHLDSSMLKSFPAKALPIAFTVHKSKDGPFSCPYCEYSCTKAFRLELHLRRKHTGERPFICPHCTFRCFDSHHLQRHIQGNHTGERPFRCPACAYCSFVFSNLRCHMRRQHTGELPISCPHCEFSCTHYSSLKRHIQVKHIGERPFTCSHCEFSCTYYSRLKRHIQGKHTEERSSTCSHCAIRCFDSSTLKRHMQRKHSGKRPL